MKSKSASVSTDVFLVRTADLKPSAYNPRLTDPVRLDLIELSMRKLGFLLPIYATPDGEILSGHQRHLVAQRMGLALVPVCYTKPLAMPDRKALNIVFNRGTNDLEPWETPRDLTEALNRANVYHLAQQIPDKFQNHYEAIRCMHPLTVPVEALLKANTGRWKQYAANVSRTLQLKGIIMPIIVTPDLRVVNGIGRLQVAASRKQATVQVVTITPREAQLADAMLNLLSMDFDLHRRYRDLLRYNSFRRARRVRSYLGRGFVFAVIGAKPAHTFDIRKPASRARWIKVHGNNVVDFGAGHLHETKLLASAGIACLPFEPYRIGKRQEIDKAESHRLATDFLDVVSTPLAFSSVFISSVFNSVPFADDRLNIVQICAALCEPATKVYAVASSTDQTDWESLMGAEFLNRKNLRTIAFKLEYERGIKLGEFSSKPKVQKYHTPAEFKALFATCFGSVTIREVSNNVEAIAAQAKPVDRAALRRALEFEFDLPYPDGSRLGLVKEALAAFSARLGVAL